METQDDGQLLRAFCLEGSQEAFAALARRYAGLLYHAALRQTGSPGLAEEAAQNALAILARKAASLQPGPSLAAWLHRTVCFEACKLRRRERRHENRLQHHYDSTIASMPATPYPPPGDSGSWQTMAPHLDEVLNELSEPDRQVVLLKYFEGWTSEEMARQLGGQAAAWRQRGSRALERLRSRLARRGVVVPLTVLTAGLGSFMSQNAPAAVAASLAASPLLTAASLSWKTLVLHTLHLMNAKQISIAAALAVVLMIPLGFQAAAVYRSQSRAAALETTASALQAAAGLDPSSTSLGGMPGSGITGSAPAKNDASTKPGIDLVEIAGIMAQGRNADPLQVLKIRTMLTSLDASILDDLLVAAELVDLPPDHRRALYDRMLSMMAEKDPARATAAGLRLVGTLSGNEATSLWMNPLPNCLREWAEKDPGAARAWYDQQKLADAFQNKNLDDADLDGWMAAGLFTGMMWGGDRQAGMALYANLDDAAKGISLQRFGTSNTNAADHAEILKLAAGISEPAAKTSALMGAAITLGRSHLERAGSFIAEAELPTAETRKLLVAAALAPLRDSKDIDAAGRVAWLRARTPTDQQEKALGYFLGEATFTDHADIREKVDAEMAAGASHTFLGAFIRNASHRTSTMDVAVSYLSQLTDPAERSRTLREMQQGHRDAARTAAVHAGVSLIELDAAINSN